MSSEDLHTAVKSKTYEFGEFQLDGKRLLLLRKSEVVPLAPKACEVMLALVEGGGRVVLKKEIIEKVWSNTHVEEANLTHHISALRKALGEDKNSKKFIETIPRRGYRFVAPVKVVESGELTVSERTTARMIEEIEIEAPHAGPAQIIEPEELSPAALPKQIPQPKKGLLSKRSAFFLSVGLLSAFGAAFFAWLAVFKESGAVPATKQPMIVARLTDSGKVGTASISPDGKFVIFSQNYTDGVGAMYIRQTDTNIETRLVMHDKGEFGTKTFSPDGMFVFYIVRDATHANFALYRVPVLGGSPVRLVENLDNGYFALSPDGSQIAVARNEAEQKQTSLVAFRLDGSGAEQVLLTRPLREMFLLPGGAWSPDGRQIVLPVRTAAATNNYSQYVTNVMLFDLATGELRNFTEETWSDFGIMCWMPDASGVVAIGKRPRLRNQIYFISNPSGEVTRITNDASSYGNYGLGITKDGSTLVADVWEFQGRIWKIDQGGDTKTAVRLLAGDTTIDAGLTTLPDGRIVYSTRSSSGFDLWTLGESDSEPRPLTSDAFYDSGAVASPDGSFIVFASDRAGSGTSHLFRMKTDGSRIEQLTFGEGLEYTPDISPDGSFVIYHSVAFDAAKAAWINTIRKIPSAGGPPVQLHEDCFVPSFSPDGQSFACTAPADNYRGKIIVGNVGDGQAVKTFDVDYFFHMNLPVRWTPDGTGLVFRNNKNQTSNLWKQNLSGGPPVQLTDFKSEIIYNFVFSRDGRHLLVSRGNSAVNVVMVKYFR